jgi:hypothetical protein
VRHAEIRFGECASCFLGVIDEKRVRCNRLSKPMERAMRIAVITIDALLAWKSSIDRTLLVDRTHARLVDASQIHGAPPVKTKKEPPSSATRPSGIIDRARRRTSAAAVRARRRELGIPGDGGVSNGRSGGCSSGRSTGLRGAPGGVGDVGGVSNG